MRKQYFKPHKNTFLFLNKLYSFNYCASKLLYIYFVFFGPQIILGALIDFYILYNPTYGYSKQIR